MSRSPDTRSRALRGLGPKLLLLAGSLSFFFISLELGARIVRGEWGWENLRMDSGTILRSAYPAAYDANLGWGLKKGFGGERNAWGTEVTINEDGVRTNGSGALGKERALFALAVGDSFTFGDTVSDHESWPARLEQILDRRVTNGGVFGYGVDQCYLRALQLMERETPEVLIYSLIHDDIGRAELVERTGAGKPYFEPTARGLELRNQPVPEPSREMKTDRFRDVAGYSLIVHLFMKNFYKPYWLVGQWQSTPILEPGKGGEVLCGIFQELAEMHAAGKARVLVLMQYRLEDIDEDGLARYDGARRCGREAGIEVLDLGPELLALKAESGEKLDSFFDGHMTAAGNAWVAERIAVRLRDVGWAD